MIKQLLRVLALGTTAGAGYGVWRLTTGAAGWTAAAVVAAMGVWFVLLKYALPAAGVPT